MRIALAVLAVSSVLGGCAGMPTSSTPVAGQQAAFDGRVFSVDTSPWAYDGNGVVTVDSDVHGRISVQLPARWNLCKAPPVAAQSLKPGDRVHVVAGVDARDRVTVCERADHRLERIPG
ncbi:hypothetical protein [Cognatilysobacter lacus]|uniref:DUF5666 domain-containing protein n=1 Tax=Cognatilysobacter lacus TaxID=1643323 RepID=A0A5D8Z853_9GAMM|nr:hypothetical protein [Lysobacter lacus]TZF90971.1 hypothetical protein FW784_03175 [Lysobacter lacus]